MHIKKHIMILLAVMLLWLIDTPKAMPPTPEPATNMAQNITTKNAGIQTAVARYATVTHNIFSDKVQPFSNAIYSVSTKVATYTHDIISDKVQPAYHSVSAKVHIFADPIDFSEAAAYVSQTAHGAYKWSLQSWSRCSVWVLKKAAAAPAYKVRVQFEWIKGSIAYSHYSRAGDEYYHCVDALSLLERYPNQASKFIAEYEKLFDNGGYCEMLQEQFAGTLALKVLPQLLGLPKFA